MSEVALVEKENAKTTGLFEELNSIFSQKHRTVQDKKKQAKDMVLSYEGEMTLVGNREPNEYSSFGNRLYIKQVLPYGFQLVSILVKQKETLEIEAIYQLDYDLRNDIHQIIKNGNELKFREQNMQNIFKGIDTDVFVETLDRISIKKGYDVITIDEYNPKPDVGAFINPEYEVGMYNNIYIWFGRIGQEKYLQLTRALERFMNNRSLELLYKSGLPFDTLRDFEVEIEMYLEKNKFRKTYTSGNKPYQVLGVTKRIFHLIKEGKIDFSVYKDTSKELKDFMPTRKSFDKEEDFQKSLNHFKQEKAKVWTQLANIYQQLEELDEQYNTDRAFWVFKREASHIGYDLYNYKRLETAEEIEFGQSCVFIAKKINSPVKKVLEYLYYKLLHEQGLDSLKGMSGKGYFRDYTNMRMLLRARMPKFPDALKTKHDILSVNVQSMEDKKLNELAKQQVPRWKAWEQTSVESSKFQMVAPESTKDLSIEASQMHNCVAGYANAVAKGKTNILFLREKEDKDKSVATIEIKYSPKNLCYVIAQAKLRDNQPIEKEHYEFLKQWANKNDMFIRNT